MKKIINLSTILLACLLLGSSLAYADDPNQSKKQKEENAVQQLVDGQRYTFFAQSAMPMSGPTKQLSYGYDMRVSKDTIAAYLPYYGVGYVAPMDMTGGGVEFTSTDFDYKVEKVKKGWNIHIKINDDREHYYDLMLFVSTSGMATLQVNDNTRQSISFYGEVEKR